MGQLGGHWSDEESATEPRGSLLHLAGHDLLLLHHHHRWSGDELLGGGGLAVFLYDLRGGLLGDVGRAHDWRSDIGMAYRCSHVRLTDQWLVVHGWHVRLACDRGSDELALVKRAWRILYDAGSSIHSW